MDRAETIINGLDTVAVLPNQAIVDKMQEMGLNIDDRIAHNPNFVVNLFRLFDIDEITDMKISEEGITLINRAPAMKYVYTITPNSENGLTMIRDVKDDSEGMHFLRSRKIVSLFPSENGFKKVTNYQQGVGHMNSSEIIETNILSITEVDSKGLETSTNTIRDEGTNKVYIFSFHPSIMPLTGNEYDTIMNKRIETKSYGTHIERTRDPRNLTLVHERADFGGHKIKNNYYFENDELYELIDLDKATSNQKTDVNKLISNLAARYDVFDPAMGRLMINLVNLLNQDVTISIVKPNDHEKNIQRQLLETFESGHKKTNV
jgi:hypothetical protein